MSHREKTSYAKKAVAFISSSKQMNPITRKSMSKLIIQPSFRAVGQKLAEWQTFEKIRDKCMAGLTSVLYGRADYLLFVGFSNACPFACVWLFY